MVEVRRGDIWWIQFGPARGSTAAKIRPAIVIQSDAFNRSRLQTTVVVPLTSMMRLADAPGNVTLSRRRNKLPKDSVANVSGVTAVDRSCLRERHGDLPADLLEQVDAGLRRVLALPGA